MNDWKSDLVKVTDLLREMRGFEDKRRRVDVGLLILNVVLIMICAATPTSSWAMPILFVSLGCLASYCLARASHPEREEIVNLRIETRVAFELALDRIANKTFNPRDAYFTFEHLTVRFRSLALWYRPLRELHHRPFARAVYGPARSPQEPSDGHRPAGEHAVVSDETPSRADVPLPSSPTESEDASPQVNEE